MEKIIHKPITIISFHEKLDPPDLSVEGGIIKRFVNVKSLARNPRRLGITGTGLNPKAQEAIALCPLVQNRLKMWIAHTQTYAESYALNFYIFCGTGKGKSVAFAEILAAELRKLGYEPTVVHRDLHYKKPKPIKAIEESKVEEVTIA